MQLDVPRDVKWEHGWNLSFCIKTQSRGNNVGVCFLCLVLLFREQMDYTSTAAANNTSCHSGVLWWKLFGYSLHKTPTVALLYPLCRKKCCWAVCWGWGQVTKCRPQAHPLNSSWESGHRRLRTDVQTDSRWSQHHLGGGCNKGVGGGGPRQGSIYCKL